MKLFSLSYIIQKLILKQTTLRVLFTTTLNYKLTITLTNKSDVPIIVTPVLAMRSSTSILAAASAATSVATTAMHPVEWNKIRSSSTWGTSSSPDWSYPSSPWTWVVHLSFLLSVVYGFVFIYLYIHSNTLCIIKVDLYFGTWTYIWFTVCKENIYLLEL